MGRYRNQRTRTTKNKDSKKSHDTKRRRRDIDQIQDDIEKIEATSKEMKFEMSDDLPGMGQFYCTECSRHFANLVTLNVHKTSKPHRRRCKDLLAPKYTQAEADAAAGKTKEILPPAHPVATK
jgi:hypothetical protein